MPDHYTSELPKVRGYYWWRRHRASKACIREIATCRGIIVVGDFNGNAEPLNPVENNGYWCGPITPP